jgi:hypothetical protein
MAALRPMSDWLRLSLLPRVGGGGEGAELSALSLPGLHSRSVRTSARSFPCRCHCRWGLGGRGAPAAAVAGRGGSDRKGSGGSDNDMFCCGMWSYVVFLVCVAL